jgi:hypothetical protein
MKRIDVWQNAYDTAANYGISQLDVPQSLNGYATWELPFGKGRRFGLHGAADEALGGWRFTGVFQAHSGIAFTPCGWHFGREQLAGQPMLLRICLAAQCGAWRNPKESHPSISAWFNTAAFAVPANNTFGNEGRNICCADQTGAMWTSAWARHSGSGVVGRSNALEVRADAFNGLNHPNFGQPSDGIGAGGGGTITYANGARRYNSVGDSLSDRSCVGGSTI